MMYEVGGLEIMPSSQLQEVYGLCDYGDRFNGFIVFCFIDVFVVSWLD